MAEWPLVGRDGELRRLRGLVMDPACPGVVVAGPAGAGKTRLATECLALAAGAGLATARVTATHAAAGLPFGALAPLLPASAGPATGDRTEFLRRSAAALVDGAGGRRLVLFVDDAHLLDDASATLVHQMVAGRLAFVLATVRAGEQAPDPVVALWKDNLVERLELGGLHAEAVKDLLQAALGAQLDGATAAFLAVRCQGNVLLLRELVLGAIRDGTLRNENGIWTLVRQVAPSDRLVELVEARLAGLKPPERAFLELVSFGEPLGSAELTVLADPELAETLERDGLLSVSTDGRRLQIRLAHPMYGDVLRARIPSLKVRRMALSLAEAVEAQGARRREDTLRVATWRLSSGGGDDRLMLAAAVTARWRYDFALAQRLVRAALDAGAGFEARLLAAQLESLRGRGSEAEQLLTELALDAADDSERARVALCRLDQAHFRLRPNEWQRIAEEAEATITDSAWRDEIAARRSWILTITEGPRAAVAAAAPLLERTKGRALVAACLASAYSLGCLGRVEEALATAALGEATHAALPEPLEWYPWTHDWMRGNAYAAAGCFGKCEQLATAQYEQALRDHSPEAQAWFAWLRSKSVAERGRVSEASHSAREAIALFRQLGWPLGVRDGLVYLALARALAGFGETAAEALQTLDSLDLPPARFSVDLIQARAWTAVANHDPPLARKSFESAAQLGLDVGDLVGAAAALHGLARLGRPGDVVERLEALAVEMEGRLVPARAAHARALCRRDPVRLGELSGEFEAMGADLLAAEAAADAAVAWRRAGEPRAAAAAGRQASALLERCQGAVTPALQSVEVRAELSPAEREAAILAAGGRTNKQIAEELCVSVRTIETRLQHVYEKLGVSGRDELGTVLTGTS